MARNGKGMKNTYFEDINDILNPIDFYDTEKEKRAYRKGFEEGSKKDDTILELMKKINYLVYAEGQITAYKELGNYILAMNSITRTEILEFIKDRVADQKRIMDGVLENE